MHAAIGEITVSIYQAMSELVGELGLNVLPTTRSYRGGTSVCSLNQKTRESGGGGGGGGLATPGLVVQHVIHCAAAATKNMIKEVTAVRHMGKTA